MDGADGAFERNSNYVLGSLLGVAGLVVLLGGYAAGFRDTASAEFFPALIALCMCVAGLWIAALGWLTRDLPPFRWTWRTLLLAGVIAAGVIIALAMYFTRTFLLLGPSEYATTILQLLVMWVAFARRSHARAAGMVLIGLLIATAGLDVITGRPRFTLGFEALLDGFDFLIVVPGVLVIGEAMLCLYSPQLWFSTFKRWLAPSLAIGPRWPVFLRVLCVFAILASLWLAWELNHRAWDLVLSLLSGLFGVACLLFGWNRLILCFALYYGSQLEQSLRQSLVISRNDFMIFIDRPLSRLHIALAIGMLLIAFALWLRRVVKSRNA